jgi:hypothetical protein
VGKNALITQANCYIIYFTGTLVVKNSGNFRIQSNTDDGAKVVIDGTPVLDYWINQGTLNRYGIRVALAEGRHKIEFWYYDNLGGDDMNFFWMENANDAPSALRPINGNDFIIN